MRPSWQWRLTLWLFQCCFFGDSSWHNLQWFICLYRQPSFSPSAPTWLYLSMLWQLCGGPLALHICQHAFMCVCVFVLFPVSHLDWVGCYYVPHCGFVLTCSSLMAMVGIFSCTSWLFMCHLRNLYPNHLVILKLNYLVFIDGYFEFLINSGH